MARTTWKKATLKSLCHRIGDGLHGTPEYSDSEIYFINGNNLENGAIKITENTKTVSEEELEKHHIPLNENTLLISINGTIGELGFYNGEKVMLGKSAAYLNFKSPINRFYFYYFQLPEIQKYFWNVATGSTIKNLSLKSLQDLEVPVPEEFEWKQISSTLSSLDSKIELNNRINAELEALAKTIYDYWFVQFDFPISAAQAAEMGNPELEGKPYKSSGGAMVWNEQLKREVPKGWGNYSLSEIGDIIGGSTPSKAKKEYFTAGGSGIPWITPKDLAGRKGKRFISHGEFDVTEAGRKSASLKIMPKGTVLLSSRAPVGYMAIAKEPVTTNQGFKSLVPNDGFSTEYVFLTVQLYLPAIIKKASGSTFAEISSSTLKTVEIASPPHELIEKFTATVAPMFAQQDVLEQENQELASLRDWLLPMLMNGQVNVNSDEDSEKKNYEKSDVVNFAAEERENYKK
ncbi:restriction endonuclease subunit S [Flavobacteriales bacterium DA487]